MGLPFTSSKSSRKTISGEVMHVDYAPGDSAVRPMHLYDSTLQGHVLRSLEAEHVGESDLPVAVRH